MEKQMKKISLKRKYSGLSKEKEIPMTGIKRFKGKITKPQVSLESTPQYARRAVQQQEINKVSRNFEKKSDRNSELFKLTKKERKQFRKRISNNNYDLIVKCKCIWETLRRHDCSKENQEELCKQLSTLVQGKVKQIVFTHDASRVLECLIALGSEQQKEEVFQEIKEYLLDLCKSKYSKFVVQKFLKYGSKDQRRCIISSFSGHVQKLLKHSVASDVLEYAFNEFSNSSQKSSLLKELYGSLFKDSDISCMQELIKSEPLRKDFILRCMKDCILSVVDKPVMHHSLIHRILRDYFIHADPTMKSEMIETLQDSCASILHTRDGSKVVCNCLWFGTAKDRKVIIKSFASHVAKICQEEYGHLTLLATFDVVDDTKLVSKVILKEIKQDLEELVANNYGRKVLYYLLNPRNKMHFHPDIIKILESGDCNPHSKKSKDVRHKELCEVISPSLLAFITDKMKDLIFSNATSLLVLDVLLYAVGDPTSAFEALGKLASMPFTMDQPHLINHTAGHLVLKRLILNDKQRAVENKSPLFSEILLEMLPSTALQSWTVCNRGAFTLCSLLETNLPEIFQKVKAALTPLLVELHPTNVKGAEILWNKLKANV